MNLHDFPEIERSTRLQGGVGFHRHALLKRLPDALGLQVGRGEHQQEHTAVLRGEHRDWAAHTQNTRARKENQRRHQPHDETHDDVKLQLPRWPWQALCARRQHVVGQRGVQDEHELGAAASDQLELPDDPRRGEVGCKPEGEARRASFSCWVGLMVVSSLCFWQRSSQPSAPAVEAPTADQTSHCCLFALQINSKIHLSWFSSASKSQLPCAASGGSDTEAPSLAPPLCSSEVKRLKVLQSSITAAL